MPKVVENRFANVAKPASQPLKRNAPKMNSGESFEKALQQAKPKPQPKPEQRPPAGSKRVEVTHAPEDAPPEETISQQSETAASTTEQAAAEPETQADGEPIAGDSALKQDKKPEDEQAAVDPAMLQQTAVAQATPTAVPTDHPHGQQSEPALPAANAVAAKLVQASGSSSAEATDAFPDAASDTDTDSGELPAAPSTPATVKQPVGKQPAPVQTVSSRADNDAPADVAQTGLKEPQPAPAESNAELSPVVDLPPESTEDATAPPALPRPGSTLSQLTGSFELPAAKTMLAEPTSPQAAPVPPPQSPEIEFASSNHERIVSFVRTQLLPNGGTMHIRLDPPELGALLVTVRMTDGAMTASFDTSNDQATKLLSHSLGQLKQALESQGVSVEKLHVQQSPRDQQSNSSNDDKQQSHPDGQSARQEQHRREMLRRMWRRLGLIQDPLDLVA